MKCYLVGGAVRDELMGLESKDYDYVVIAPSYEVMRQQIQDEGFKIHTENPEFVTIRAGVPEHHPLREFTKDADFVLARKDSATSDGRRPDSVEPGTLEEDLGRRDYRPNAIAKDPETGDLIDPFNGQRDIQQRMLRFVGNPNDRIREDGLRVLRGFRFVITKGFFLPLQTHNALFSDLAVEMLYKVSVERIQIELDKMFKHDMERTLHLIGTEMDVMMRKAIFRDSLRLTTTMKTR